MTTILQNHYVLAVHDTAKMAHFFQKLGFNVVSDPTGWVFVAKDSCLVMLAQCPDALPVSRLGDHNYFAYLRVDNAIHYYQDLADNGVTFLFDIIDRPWGMREFGVVSPEGHRIMIGQWIG